MVNAITENLCDYVWNGMLDHILYIEAKLRELWNEVTDYQIPVVHLVLLWKSQ